MRKDIKPYQLAVIGGSTESAVGRVHLVASRMDFRWEPVAGCFSRNKDINMKSAEYYRIKPTHVYDNWMKMLDEERGEIDAVLVASPIPSHYEMVKSALRLGVPVICEKALTDSLNNGEELDDIVKKEKGFLALTYNYTGYPMVRELRNMIQLGSFGKIISFVFEMPQETYLSLNVDGKPLIPQGWRLEDREIPVLYLDLATHMHQMLTYITGRRIEKVIAKEGSYGNYPVVDDVMVLCECEKDLSGLLWFSKAAIGERNGLKVRINGTNKSATWVQTNPEELIVCSSNGERKIMDRKDTSVVIASQQRYNRFKAGHPDGFLEAFANIYFDIADCLKQYKKDGYWESNEIFGSDFAVEGLKLLAAIRRSTKTKKWEIVG